MEKSGLHGGRGMDRVTSGGDTAHQISLVPKGKQSFPQLYLSSFRHHVVEDGMKGGGQREGKLRQRVLSDSPTPPSLQ